jgi:hypothetical protein
MGIEINTGNNGKLSQAMYESISKMSGNESADLNEVVGKAMEILAGANLNVTKADTAGTGGAAEKKTTGSTNVPALDDPGDQKQAAANLEKLVSYLELDNEDRQTEMAKDRIKLQKETLDAEHENRMDQIDESLEKMRDAETSSKWSRAFSWIGAIVAIAAAVALTICTGGVGVAAAFAIAGAVISVASLTLNETGAMDKITDAMAESLRNNQGMSKRDAQLAASLICNLSIAVLSLGCGIGSMVSSAASVASTAANVASTAQKAAAVSESTAKTVQTVMTVANTGVSAGSLLTTGVSTYFNKRSEESKADTTEMEKFIQELQNRLEQSSEELQALLEQIQSGIGTIAQMISSSTDTSDEIANNLGAMA